MGTQGGKDRALRNMFVHGFLYLECLRASRDMKTTEKFLEERVIEEARKYWKAI
jgi:hypothetical protein